MAADPPERSSPYRMHWGFAVLCVLGLALRAAFISQPGTTDVGIDLEWGRQANEDGLPATYVGNYFPLQYQVFQAVVALASVLPVGEIFVFKTVNLIADVGVFLLLVRLLQHWNLNPRYAFVYWLHPYFLSMFWLGYIDSQFTFFVLLGILALTTSESRRDYLVAGVPFAFAWLLKPQPVVGAVMVGVYCLLLVVEAAARETRISMTRAKRLALLFVAPAVFWAGYEAWFTLETGRARALPWWSYHGLIDFMPVLTAQMLNIWHPIAEHYRSGSEFIFEIEGPAVLHSLAQVLTSVLLVTSILLVWRFGRARSDDIVVLLLFVLGAAIVPMTMTRAHENHFFLAATLLIPVCSLYKTRFLNAAVFLFLLIQFVNIFGLYGFGDNAVSEQRPISDLREWYVPSVRYVLALASIVLFALIIGFMWRRLAHDGEPLVGARRRPPLSFPRFSGHARP